MGRVDEGVGVVGRVNEGVCGWVGWMRECGWCGWVRRMKECGWVGWMRGVGVGLNLVWIGVVCGADEGGGWNRVERCGWGG